MKAYYTQKTWKNENYRFFRWKAWLKALSLSITPTRKEVRVKMKSANKEAA